MISRHLVRTSALALVVLGLGACNSAPVSVADPAATLAPAATAGSAIVASAAPGTAPRGGALPRPVTSGAPGAARAVPPGPSSSPSSPTAPLPGPAAQQTAPAAPGTVRLSDPVSPDGVPFVPASPAPEAPATADPLTPAVPELSALFASPEPDPTPALSVPFGVYAAGGYNGTTTEYTAAMAMRSDGTYSMTPATGAEIPDPSTGQAGTYQVLNGSALEFLTGPYAGVRAALIPDYQATGRDFIDLTVDGVFISYHFEHA